MTIANELPSLEELCLLDARALLNMQCECETRYQQVKANKEYISHAISLKYSDHIATLRGQLDKPTGVVRFEDDTVLINADLPKRPHWDQNQLADIAEKIRENGEDPSEFMTIGYKVPESKYNAWPKVLRDQFSPARTLKFGAQKLELKERIL